MTPLMSLLADLASINLGLLLLALLALLVLAKEIGFAIGSRARRAGAAQDAAGQADRQKEGVGLVTGGMLALVAFILALAMSMAQGRHDARRDVVRDEANAIGTVWLRADFAGPAAEPIRALMRDYAASRLETVVSPPGPGDVGAELARTNAMQGRIWALASTAARENHTPEAALLIASLNDMFDLSLTSRRAFTDRVPIGILRMLLWSALITMGVVGYNFGLAGARHLVFSGLLLVFWSGSMVLIVDLNNPTKGWIKVDPAPMVWTIQGFGPAPSP